MASRDDAGIRRSRSSGSCGRPTGCSARARRSPWSRSSWRCRSRRCTAGGSQYGGMKADDAKRLKELERENARLKRIVADQLLENRGAEGDREGKLVSPSRRREAVAMLRRAASACLSGGRAGSSASTAPRQRHQPRRDRIAMTRCGRGCATLRPAHPRWGYRLAWARGCARRAGR